MKLLIIGGGAAGASCATRFRRLNEQAQITILERTDEVSIANCGLPYYISGVIKNRDNILVSNPQKFKSWFNIDVKLKTEVIQINKEEKHVITNTGERISYDYLVIATGATPIVPNFEGLNKDKTFVVRSLADADKIKAYIKENNIQNVAIIGGGFIGVEVAENMIEMGLKTSLIEMNNQILSPLDPEMIQLAHKEMFAKGIDLILSEGHIQSTFLKSPVTYDLTCLSDSCYLRMRKGILVGVSAIVTPAYYPALMHYDTANRHLAKRIGFSCLPLCFLHVF